MTTTTEHVHLKLQAQPPVGDVSLAILKAIVAYRCVARDGGDTHELVQHMATTWGVDCDFAERILKGELRGAPEDDAFALDVARQDLLHVRRADAARAPCAERDPFEFDPRLG